MRSRHVRPLVLERLETRLCPALTLTGAGIDRGFALSTFATDFPNEAGAGPMAAAFPTSGGVLVTDYPGNVRLFPDDSDGQSARDVRPGQMYGSNSAKGLAKVGDAIYMTQTGSSRLLQLNDERNLNRVIVDNLPGANGIAPNPKNGHLFVGAQFTSQLVDVDPVSRTINLVALGFFDAVVVSADASTLYAVRYGDGHVLGFDIDTYAPVFDSGAIPGLPDGIGEGTGKLAGNLYVNCNNGTVVEVNVTTLEQTLIATGGSRGDFMTVTPDGSSFLVSQTDRMERLRFPSESSPGIAPHGNDLALLPVFSPRFASELVSSSDCIRVRYQQGPDPAPTQDSADRLAKDSVFPKSPQESRMTQSVDAELEALDLLDDRA